MLEEIEENNGQVKDLEEGDIASIYYRNRYTLVYVFRRDEDSCLDMVAIGEKGKYWNNTIENNLKVIKIFKKGEQLVIC